MKSTPARDEYKVFYPITTRWKDNDAYGHVNNVVYYSYFDTVVNLYLIDKGVLDIQASPIVGYVVSSGCDYLSPVSYPDPLEAGLRVDRLGRSSVQYGIGIFKAGNHVASACGHLIHVFVDRSQHRSVPIPDAVREALEVIVK